MRNGLRAFFIHFFVTVFFIIVALAYFHPVLQGKVIEQSDIVQFTGMAKEQNDFRKKTGEEPRSEERRVGKEGRTRGSRRDEKKKERTVKEENRTTEY